MGGTVGPAAVASRRAWSAAGAASSDGAPRPAVPGRWDGLRPLALPILVSAILACLPFFWLGSDATLGGDDTRLYLVYPWLWLRRIALSSFGDLVGFGVNNPSMYLAPITAVFSPLALVAPWLNLQAAAFGLALVSGFVGVYASALLLLPAAARYRRAAAALAGLLYVSAPLPAVTYWATPLSLAIGINGAPALAAAALRYLRSGRPAWLALGTLLAAFFATASFSLPVSLPFALGGLFVVLVVLATDRTGRPLLVRRGLVLLAVVAGASAFWWLPLGASALTPGGFGNDATGMAGSYAGTIRTDVHGQSILDTLALLPSGEFERYFGQPAYLLWPWMRAFQPLSMLLPAVILWAVASPPVGRKGAALPLALTATVLVLAYFQTLNITRAGVELFVTLVATVPGSRMFVNYFSKFAAALALSFCLAFALAVPRVLARCRPAARPPLLLALALAVLLPGLPLLSGAVVKLPLSTSGGTAALTEVGRLPPSYRAAMRFLATQGDTGRVLELPLSANVWSILPLSPAGAVYAGVSPVRLLSGHQTFNSVDAFAGLGPDLHTRLAAAVARRDLPTLADMLRLSGVRYVVYTTGLPTEAGGRWLAQPVFPGSAEELARLGALLGAGPPRTFTDGAVTTEVYVIPAERTLPLLYVAGGAGPAGDQSAARDGPGPVPLPLAAPAAGATVRSRRVASWRYEAEVTVDTPAVLVLLEPYGPGWEARARADGAAGEVALAKVRADGYATGWRIDRPGRYAITLSYGPQRFTWLGLAVSLLTLLVVIAATLRTSHLTSPRRGERNAGGAIGDSSLVSETGDEGTRGQRWPRPPLSPLPRGAGRGVRVAATVLVIAACAAVMSTWSAVRIGDVLLGLAAPGLLVRLPAAALLWAGLAVLAVAAVTLPLGNAELTQRLGNLLYYDAAVGCLWSLWYLVAPGAARRVALPATAGGRAGGGGAGAGQGPPPPAGDTALPRVVLTGALLGLLPAVAIAAGIGGAFPGTPLAAATPTATAVPTATPAPTPTAAGCVAPPGEAAALGFDPYAILSQHRPDVLAFYAANGWDPVTRCVALFDDWLRHPDGGPPTTAARYVVEQGWVRRP